jgi:hypothetical protein
LIEEYKNIYMIVYSNYTSNCFDPKSRTHYYRFWYYGSFIDLKCSEKFSRGDIVKIVFHNTNEIVIERLPNQIAQEKLPVFMFAVSRIPLGMTSDFEFSCSEEDTILFTCKNVKNKNSSYILAFLSLKDKSKIVGIDKNTAEKIEFVIE